MCEDVPLEYCGIYALVTYLFLRGGELKALTWPGVDIKRGIVSVRGSFTSHLRDDPEVHPHRRSGSERLSAKSSRRFQPASPPDDIVKNIVRATRNLSN